MCSKLFSPDGSENPTGLKSSFSGHGGGDHPDPSGATGGLRKTGFEPRSCSEQPE